MASTSTTETRGRDKRPAVPVLLEAFPIPPSFIPPSPLLNNSTGPIPRSTSPLFARGSPPQYKHPLYAPPSGPLPPVPGPSPITERDTLMFISAARSRRASRMSLASESTQSHRDSIASASGSSVPSLSPSTSATPYDSSRSIRSYSSSSSLAVPAATRHIERSPVIQPRIAEEDAADLTRMSLDEISMHSPLPEHISDDEKVLEIGRSRRKIRHDPRDSISSVDISDIPPLRDDEADVEIPVVPPSPPDLPSATVRQPVASTSTKNKALPPLPPIPPQSTPKPLSRSKSQPQTHNRRSSSPDISEILATTPRPRRKSSHGSGLRSRSTSRSVHNLKRRPSEFLNEARSAPVSRRTSTVANPSRRTSAASGSGRSPRLSHTESPTELAYAQSAMARGSDEGWDEDSFVSDYGVPLDETGTPYDILDGDEEARLDRELDGDGSDSDSSLDLHTPLPHLMVKDGLLSPNSKLVNQASRNTTPLPGDRPGSVFSVTSTVGSVMTKNGLFKDERDTVKRRVRHRDGKLLRGGIGLTTGLGWSDSEDEDAPAPLVRQLSARSLKQRAASSSSMRSLNSVTRSYSEHMSESRMEEFGLLPKMPRTSAPPTSWQRPRQASGLDRRTSTSSSLSSVSSASALSGAFSRTSVTSHRSAPASVNRRGIETPSLSMNSLGHIREGDEVGFNTPSTSSSTGSLTTPVTPADSPAQLRSHFHSLGSKRPPAKLDLLPTADLTPRDVVILTSPNSRSLPSSTLPSPALSTSTFTSTPRTASVPRPLRLPQAQGSLRTPSDATSTSTSTRTLSSSTPSRGNVLRAPQTATARPITTVSSTGGALSQERVSFPSRGQATPSAVARSSSTPAANPPPSAGASRLKPRTGTGMVYRTTPNTPVSAMPPAVVRPTMMRMPSSTSLRSAKGVRAALA